MTISSSARHTACVGLVLVLAVVLATAVLVIWMTALGERAQHVAEHAVTGDAVAAENAAVAAEDAAAAARVVATLGPSGKELLSALYINFDLATRGADSRKSRMTAMPRENSAGLLCNPATLDRNTATFRMVLPAAPTDRKGILAALAPDGSLRIIYISYIHDETDPEDLIIPSRSIDWERARTRKEFVVDAAEFEALRPNTDRPEPLFRQAGIYQFALLNGDRKLLEINHAPFWVIAGCVVRWQP